MATVRFLRQQFEELDHTGRGFLDLNGLRALCVKVGHSPNLLELQAIMANIGCPQNKITFAQFFQVYKKFNDPILRKSLHPTLRTTIGKMTAEARLSLTAPGGARRSWGTPITTSNNNNNNNDDADASATAVFTRNKHLPARHTHFESDVVRARTAPVLQRRPMSAPMQQRHDHGPRKAYPKTRTPFLSARGGTRGASSASIRAGAKGFSGAPMHAAASSSHREAPAVKVRKPKTHKAEIFRLYASDPTEEIGLIVEESAPADHDDNDDDDGPAFEDSND